MAVNIDTLYEVGTHAASTVTARIEQNPWTAAPKIGIDVTRQLSKTALAAAKLGTYVTIGLMDLAAQKSGLVSGELDPRKPADLLEIQELELAREAHEVDEHGRKRVYALLEDPDRATGFFMTWLHTARRKDASRHQPPKPDKLLLRDFGSMLFERVGDDIRTHRTVERVRSWVRERDLVDLSMTDIDTGEKPALVLGSMVHPDDKPQPRMTLLPPPEDE